MDTALDDGSRSGDEIDLHERDFYTRSRRQADLPRAGLFETLDLDNVIEELETLGRSEAAAQESAFRLISLHQLKRMVQPERAASRNWTNTIVRERLQAARLLRDNLEAASETRAHVDENACLVAVHARRHPGRGRLGSAAARVITGKAPQAGAAT